MLAGSPLRAVLPPACATGSASAHVPLRPRNTGKACGTRAHGKAAHPIDNFDKNDRRTLESFNSLDGRIGCDACSPRSDWPGGERKIDPADCLLAPNVKQEIVPVFKRLDEL